MNIWLTAQLAEQRHREALQDAATQRLLASSGLRQSASVRQTLARWAHAYGQFWIALGNALEGWES